MNESTVSGLIQSIHFYLIAVIPTFVHFRMNGSGHILSLILFQPTGLEILTSNILQVR